MNAAAKAMQSTQQEGFSLPLWPIPPGGCCPVCAAGELTHASRYPDKGRSRMFGDAIVVWCGTCGSGYVPGADSFIEHYYAAEYAASNRRDRDTDPPEYFSEEFRERSKRVRRYFGRSTQHLKILEKHGARFETVLDFGSGPGYFLFLSEARRKYAVEPDLASRKYLDYLGAVSVSLEDVSPGSCSAVVSSHSLEHLTARTLAPVIKRLRESLEPGGHLLVEVPHGGFSYARVTVKHEPHTLFFTPEGLCRALAADGYSLVYRSAHGKTEVPAHSRPIYTPDDNNAFYSAYRGRLVAVLRREV